MVTKEILPKDLNYYKANLHCHTTFSDGVLTPQQIKEEYSKRGYQIVAFTDHNTYRNHSELNDDTFLAIASMESDINRITEKNFNWSMMPTYHLNFYDTRPDYKVEEKMSLAQPQQTYDIDFINDYVKSMKDLGFIACYNHPYWSMQNYDDFKALQGFWAMEIYNHGCQADGLYGYHPQAYDEMLRTGQRLCCLATDDNHNREPFDSGLFDSFGGYVMIGAKDLSYSSIMQALLDGQFYSCVSPDGHSEAPRIHHLALNDGLLRIECSPCDKIFVKTKGRNCYRAAANYGELLTKAEFQIDPQEEYIHVLISDGQGRYTHSNSIQL